MPQLFADGRKNLETVKAGYEKQMKDLYAEIGRLTTIFRIDVNVKITTRVKLYGSGERLRKIQVGIRKKILRGENQHGLRHSSPLQR